MARKEPKSPAVPRREDPGLSSCPQGHGVVIHEASGAILTPMGAVHDCTEIRLDVAALSAAWTQRDDGSWRLIRLEPYDNTTP